MLGAWHLPIDEPFGVTPRSMTDEHSYKLYIIGSKQKLQCPDKVSTMVTGESTSAQLSAGRTTVLHLAHQLGRDNASTPAIT